VKGSTNSTGHIAQATGKPVHKWHPKELNPQGDFLEISQRKREREMREKPAISTTVREKRSDLHRRE
jgi:hypothetical protein